MTKVQYLTEPDGLEHTGITYILPVESGSLADKKLCHVSDNLFAKHTVFDSYRRKVSGSGFMGPL